MKLESLGWDSFFANHFTPFQEKGLHPARVALEHKNAYLTYSAFGELTAELTGKMRYQALHREDLPAVGDWVAIQHLEDESRAVIHGVLPRKSKFIRKAAGEIIEIQILASNIETAFLVSGLDHDFNPRRLERFLTLTWDSGASPVILLNKTDICDDLEAKMAKIEEIAINAPIIPLSAENDEDLSALSEFLQNGETVVLLGSSGVGKSTIINRLLGKNVQAVQEVREDDSRGRHTTTHRELFVLDNGAMIIDTPGLREIQLWDSGDGLQETFEDVEELAANCRFRDCKHQNEPGCEVKKALLNGELSRERYESYQKLQKELAYIDRLQDQREALEEKRRAKIMSKTINRMYKDRD
ncbi:MAG: ribosome small subunit-dependent GTPase A [Deferribacteres bacterium]|nr:ribosome small subunit-dependent GTPase A [candidate division KSB1 bacterium]MCB9511146.1 ribosome small subunit-dependent GTPase A [Deferribacteres bacterium]